MTRSPRSTAPGHCALLLALAASVLHAAPQDPAEREATLRSFHAANGLLNRGLYELAAKEYQSFLAEHPGHPQAPTARYGLGVCLYRMNDFAAAAEQLQHAMEDSEDFTFAAEAQTTLGQCLLALERPAEAAEAFALVLRRHGDHDLADDAAAGRVEALHRAGDLAAAADAAAEFVERWGKTPLAERVLLFGALSDIAGQEHARAAAALGTLLKRFPQGTHAPQATLLLAQCEHQQGQLDQAEQHYRIVLGGGDDTLTPDARLGLGVLLLQRGKPEQAEPLLEQAVQTAGDSPRAPEARFHLARALFDTQDYDRAKAQFDAAAAAGGAFADQAAYWSAKCTLRGDDPAAAADRLAAVVEQTPESQRTPELLYDLAVAQARADRHEHAARTLRQFLKQHADHTLVADALYLLANCEHQLGHYPESDEACRQFLEKHARHSASARVSFLSAENALLGGDDERAASAYQAFLKRFPADPQATLARFRLGMALYRLGRVDEAATALNALPGESLEDPAFAPALLVLGEIAVQRGEWKQATLHLTRFLATHPSDAADGAWLKLGIAYARERNWTEASSALRRLVEQFPDSPHRTQALFELGQVHVAQGDTESATRCFADVLEAPGHERFAPYALNHLAALATQAGKPEQATGYLERLEQDYAGSPVEAEGLLSLATVRLADGRYKEAEAALSRLIDSHPKFARLAEARAHRAIALARQQRCDDALREMDRAERGQLPDALRASLHYERAWCLRQLDRPEDAAHAYQTMLDMPREAVGPLRDHAALELAGLEMDAKRYDAAAELLEPLLEAEPADAQLAEQALYRLGLCRFEQARLEDAAELLTRFATRFPSSDVVASALFYGGEALVRLDRHDAAVPLLERLTTEYPADPACEAALLRLGEALAALQHWPKSERVFADYLARFPEGKQWYQAAFGLGWAREHQQRYDEAMQAYRDVTARHQGPTAARAQFQIGECLYAKKQYDEAARELLKVDILYAYPEWSAAALFEAGRCLEELGREEEARAQFTAVAEKYGDTDWARMASQRLATLSDAGRYGAAAPATGGR